jgi:hypothetical protein
MHLRGEQGACWRRCGVAPVPEPDRSAATGASVRTNARRPAERTRHASRRCLGFARTNPSCPSRPRKSKRTRRTQAVLSPARTNPTDRGPHEPSLADLWHEVGRPPVHGGAHGSEIGTNPGTEPAAQHDPAPHSSEPERTQAGVGSKRTRDPSRCLGFEGRRRMNPGRAPIVTKPRPRSLRHPSMLGRTNPGGSGASLPDRNGAAMA